MSAFQELSLELKLVHFLFLRFINLFAGGRLGVDAQNRVEYFVVRESVLKDVVAEVDELAGVKQFLRKLIRVFLFAAKLL